MKSSVLEEMLENTQLERIRHGKIRTYKSGDKMLLSKGHTAIKVSVARAYFNKNKFSKAISALDKLLANKPAKGGVE